MSFRFIYSKRHYKKTIIYFIKLCIRLKILVMCRKIKKLFDYSTKIKLFKINHF